MRPLRVAALFLALAAPAAYAQDDRIIAEGVSAGGVDVGLLTVDEATAKLEADKALQAKLREPLVLGAAGIPWKLTMDRVELALDARATAERAALVPTPTGPTGEGETEGGAVPGVTVPLAVSYSRKVLRAFVAFVARGTWRAPKPAKLKMTLRHMLVTEHKRGYKLNRKAVRAKIERALTVTGERRLHQRMLKVRPKRTVADLRAAYPTVITVDRDNFRLRLFKRLRISKRYGIAVGMAGLDTPAGLYRIQNKAVDPAWTKPHSDWVPPDERGDVVPGGDPSNPLKARWLGIYAGVGIHGTSEDWSIGSRASHGCIRMHVSDVIDLYDRVPVGTPVLIG
jgi:lipoprotein-anchoring transpeptidase ErfK/SrfK